MARAGAGADARALRGLRGLQGLRADLGAGARAVLRSRPLARATAGSVCAAAAQGMLVACLPQLGTRVLGAAGRGPLLLALVAAAGLAANALLPRLPQRPAPLRVLRWTLAAQSLALLLAATGRAPSLLAGSLLLGAADGPQLTALFTLRHQEAPERLRGQVFTTGASLKLTGFALGVALGGRLGAWSLDGTLLAAAALPALGVALGVGGGPARVCSGAEVRAGVGEAWGRR
ncbi:hypothetical protein [Kitasatospora sp. LaBMicrA B282]|uniref:hypothetical protein n=1 Tax=Kitasatospora sp. LaBMicrA B282 TaxID=3420949 RepID=UPI003D11C0DF